jgi:hypothetical protein
MISEPGLPDGLFSNQKYFFGEKIWRALEWKVLLGIILPFGIIYGRLV